MKKKQDNSFYTLKVFSVNPHRTLKDVVRVRQPLLWAFEVLRSAGGRAYAVGQAVGARYVLCFVRQSAIALVVPVTRSSAYA